MKLIILTHSEILVNGFVFEIFPKSPAYTDFEYDS